MPTYDYECTNCAHRFDAFQTMSASVLKECPKCHQDKLKRLIGKGSGIIFKGPGFYSTDYRKKTPEKEKGKKPTKSCSTCSPSSGSCSTCK